MSKKLTILLVEDSTLDRETLTQALKENGHTVHACEGVYHAADLLRENLFDLVILDYALVPYNYDQSREKDVMMCEEKHRQSLIDSLGADPLWPNCDLIDVYQNVGTSGYNGGKVAEITRNRPFQLATDKDVPIICISSMEQNPMKEWNAFKTEPTGYSYGNYIGYKQPGQVFQAMVELGLS